MSTLRTDRLDFFRVREKYCIVCAAVRIDSANTFAIEGSSDFNISSAVDGTVGNIGVNLIVSSNDAYGFTPSVRSGWNSSTYNPQYCIPNHLWGGPSSSPPQQVAYSQGSFFWTSNQELTKTGGADTWPLQKDSAYHWVILMGELA